MNAVETTQAVHHAPTPEEIQLEIIALRAENLRLKANVKPSGSIKVSAKGAVSVYGLGRFPITLYSSQWENLLKKSGEIQAFIQANLTQLASKGE